MNPVSSLAHTCERRLRRCFCSRRRNYVAPPPTFLRLSPCEIHNRAVFSRLCEGSIRLERPTRHTIRRGEIAFALSHAPSRIISRRLGGRSGRMWGAWHPRGSRFPALSTVFRASFIERFYSDDRKSRYTGVVRVKRGARIGSAFSSPVHPPLVLRRVSSDSLEVARAATPAQQNKGFPFGDHLLLPRR